MSYNYGAPPGSGGGYGQHGANMGPPPGMDARSPTLMHNSQFQQPPPNMPNFSAPIIRMGVDSQARSNNDRTGGGGNDRQSGRGSNAEPLGRRDRMGLGASDMQRGGGGGNIERDRAAVRESMMALQPPTREEVARTIFIGGLGEGTPDDASLERLLSTAGKLRRWTRARDAEEKKCKFGFAEYEDVESLEAAADIFIDVEVPLFAKNGAVLKDEEGEVKMAKLLVVVDEQSKSYINEWKGRGREDADARQFRIDGCREDLRQQLAALANAGAYLTNTNASADADGDMQMADTNGNEVNGEQAEVVTIPLTLEDELSDIPADMRATVAEEIKAFRDRSNRRDLERLRREEELERAEKERAMGPNRRGASPPSSAPTGPGGAPNGVPVGPRGGVQGAPSGPRGLRAQAGQFPSDYVNGVSFVGANGAPVINREDDDAEESDKELERRRQAKKDSELEKQYQDLERRLLNRERTRAAAQEREKVREEAETHSKEREREEILRRLAEWDDEVEGKRGVEEYYIDRPGWLRRRMIFRDRELRDDARDRDEEAREQGDQKREKERAGRMADDFLDSMDIETKPAAQAPADVGGAAPGGFGGFKMNLGSAAARTRTAPTAAPARRGMENIEGLLEDEEDAAAAGLKRPELKPLTDTSTVPNTEDLSDEDRALARQQLASEIPTSTAELFAYPVKFDHLTDDIIDSQIRPFVEKKVVEFLGVQEEVLVEIVVEGLKERKAAGELVAELGEALEEESEGLMRKVWRLVVFWTELGARGLA